MSKWRVNETWRNSEIKRKRGREEDRRICKVERTIRKIKKGQRVSKV
jgi:hypothetical protein